MPHERAHLHVCPQALEDPPAVIDTADMHTLQAAPGSREAGAKVLSHCPRCPPGFLVAWCDERLPLAQRVAALVPRSLRGGQVKCPTYL